MSLVPFGNFEASLTKLEEGPETLALTLGSDLHSLRGEPEQSMEPCVFK